MALRKILPESGDMKSVASTSGEAAHENAQQRHQLSLVT
jgi:hypothetical protein